jgi:hypothetical protein
VVKTLYGRDHEFQVFGEALQRADEDGREVVVFYGPGGQGKTQLCAAVFARASTGNRQHPVCLIDFKAHPTNLVDALYAIRIAMIKGKYLQRPLFDVAFREYQKRFNPGVDIVRRFPELYVQSGAGNHTDVILEIATSALHLPFVSVAEKYARKLTDHIGHQSTIRHREELVGMETWTTSDDWHQKLVAFLAQDISESEPELGCPVILFDHYEYLWENGMEHQSLSVNVDDWVRGFCKALSRGMCVIFSREQLEHWAEIDYEWQDSLTEIALSSLSARDSLRMLSAAGVTERSIRKHIVRLASGHPLFLTVQIDTYRTIRRTGKVPQPEDFGVAKRDVISRFVDHLDPKEGLALKILSVPASFDSDTFDHVALKMPNVFFGLSFEGVSTYSFFQLRDGSAWMHNVMRSGLQEMCEPRIKRQVHELLFTYAENRWRSLQRELPAKAFTMLITAAGHKAQCDEAAYLQWLLALPEELFTAELRPELERARRIAERCKARSQELELIWWLVRSGGGEDLLSRAVEILDTHPELRFEGEEFLRLRRVAQVVASNISAEQKLDICAAVASRPAFLPGLDRLAKASFHHYWARAALECERREDYKLHQTTALNLLWPGSEEDAGSFIYLVFEMLNFLLGIGNFQELRSAAAEGVARLEMHPECESTSPKAEDRHERRLSTRPPRFALNAESKSSTMVYLTSISRRTDEELDRKIRLAYLELNDESGDVEIIETRQALAESGNIGLVVNAKGRLCMVHDKGNPFSGGPSFVGYDIRQRMVNITFLASRVSYVIDWEATDEMHQYLLKCSNILMIRMEDLVPVEGYNIALLHGEMTLN